MEIELQVNGRPVTRAVEPRLLLVHFLREELRLSGTHVGCAEGRCGCCTVLVDDRPVKSCVVLAVQVDGKSVTTIEGLATREDELHPLQTAFCQSDAAECGYCTPGMIMAAMALLIRNPAPDRNAIVEAISGNLCRCTGYENILQAIARAAEERAMGSTTDLWSVHQDTRG